MRNRTRGLVFAIGVMLSVGALPVYAADNVADKFGDWVATIGKKDLEKQTILTQRRANREAARAQREAEKQAKKAQQQAKKASKDLEKGLGGL